MLDFLIVGGGIHGTVLCHALTAHCGIRELAVVDPHSEPLTVWRRHTHACGMRYLRSPGSHNLALDFHALRDYAAAGGWDRRTAFIPPYARPLLRLFNEHAAALIRARGLESRLCPGTVRDIALHQDHVEVDTGDQRLRARYAMLCLGRGNDLCLPPWAGQLDPESRMVEHIFAPHFDREQFAAARQPLIIGAGASGVQLALASAERTGRRVTVISGHAVRVRRFDSDPCFIGPKCARDFLAQPDYRKRRALINAARRPGSIPEDVAELLAQRQRDNSVRVIVASIRGATAGRGRVRLHLSSGAEIESDRVAAATGFAPGVPAADLVGRLAQRYGLPRATDEFPIPDAYLRWHPRLFVSGSLAELELGPSAPNIIGAVAAAKRLGAYFLQRESPRSAHWTPLSRLWQDRDTQTGSSVAMRA